MRTSLNPLMYKDWHYEKLFETAGTHTLSLSPGTYYIGLRGGGGAGGSAGNNSSYEGGAGGAGGIGSFLQQQISLTESCIATAVIGTGGATSANGGNGGTGGTANGTAGGNGGGGGMPTYLFIQTTGGQLAYIAQGGGGGGGGGASGQYGRDRGAGCGGGGGGYYHIDSNGNITNYAGKIGAGSPNGDHSTRGNNGVSGYVDIFGNTAFSGNGGQGGYSDSPYGQAGGSGQPGTGSSGASGGTSEGHSSSSTGGGGGGAGGDLDAGGGARGKGGYVNNSTDAYNPHTIPTTSTDYRGVESNLGRGGIGGTSTQAATNGYNGWLYIYRFEQATDNNMGPILITTPSDITDDGEITGNVTESVDNGLITDTVAESVDDGPIFFAPPVTILNLGSVADPTTQIINNGGI